MNREYDIPHHRESKTLLLDLLMAGKGGKYCGLVSKSHIPRISFFQSFLFVYYSYNLFDITEISRRF